MATMERPAGLENVRNLRNSDFEGGCVDDVRHHPSTPPQNVYVARSSRAFDFVAWVSAASGVKDPRSANRQANPSHLNDRSCAVPRRPTEVQLHEIPGFACGTSASAERAAVAISEGEIGSSVGRAD